MPIGKAFHPSSNFTVIEWQQIQTARKTEVARANDIPQPTRDHILALECPAFPDTPWVAAKPLRECRVAILTTAALHQKSEASFPTGTAEYRQLPATLTDPAISHISINFDRSGMQRDINVAFPIDRLRELAADGVVGNVADTHYSTMGSTDPMLMSETADSIVAHLKAQQVDALLLVPV
ncbi:MAG: D-proline reductase (dithiol) PrdB [Hyphomicrobiaceae bacterium]